MGWLFAALWVCGVALTVAFVRGAAGDRRYGRAEGAAPPWATPRTPLTPPTRRATVAPRDDNGAPQP